ncbi:MAG: hypothetical protein ACR2IF_18215 [Terriglobales bacterium]
MATRNLDPAKNEELYGNNAAFSCPVCRKTFVVSGFLNKNGRKCPWCHRSTGHVENTTAFIEWNQAEEPLDVRYLWGKLNKQQVGAYAEYFVKMELTMHGFQVYSPEVDDRGIDLVARLEDGPFVALQVKAVRDFGYVFLQKSKFVLSDQLFLGLALLFEGESPELYLIPSRTWETPNALFVGRDYGEGKVSAPEWGINLSARNKPLLESYLFDGMVRQLLQRSAAKTAQS